MFTFVISGIKLGAVNHNIHRSANFYIADKTRILVTFLLSHISRKKNNKHK